MTSIAQAPDILAVLVHLTQHHPFQQGTGLNGAKSRPVRADRESPINVPGCAGWACDWGRKFLHRRQNASRLTDRPVASGGRPKRFALERTQDACHSLSSVIAGLDPAIHLLPKKMDPRVKPAGDAREWASAESSERERL